MSERKFKTFAAFWPHYLAEHSKPATRALHAVGTTMSLILLGALITLGNWWFLPFVLVPGYGAAWIAHFFVEKNRPATFTHPLWSFIGDYKMIGLMITGKIDGEIERCNQLPR